jgi:hypothetical protein
LWKHTHMWVCIHIHVCIYTCAQSLESISLRKHTCVWMCVLAKGIVNCVLYVQILPRKDPRGARVFAWMSECVLMCMCVCMYVCVCVCLCVRYVYLHRVRVYTCAIMHICICICDVCIMHICEYIQCKCATVPYTHTHTHIHRRPSSGHSPTKTGRMEGPLCVTCLTTTVWSAPIKMRRMRSLVAVSLTLIRSLWR